jgi:endonuclease YncB( thermonuclease family)
MVKRGEAWAYRRYVKDQRIIQAEQEAKKAERGLWRRSTHEAPWKFRHSH